MIRAQIGDLSSHITKYSSPALTQKVFANMRRVGKGFFRVDTPLFEGMIVAQQVDEGAAEVNVDDVLAAGVVDEGVVDVNVVLTAIDKPHIPSPTPPTQPPPSQDQPSTSQVQPTPPPSLISQPPSPQQQPQSSQDAKISMNLLHTLLETCTTLTRRVEHLEQDKIAQSLEITKLKQRVKKLKRRNKVRVSKLRRLKRVGTTQRVDTFDDTVMDDVSKQGRIIADIDAEVDVTLKDVADIAKEVAVDAEIEDITAASAIITVAAPKLTTAAALTLTTAPSAVRRRKGVVIRYHEETTTPSIIIYSETKSKDKGKGILRKEKEDNAVMRYQALKRKPQTKAQARKNMMIYLRNMARFKMDYFKGMTYDDIRPIFKKKFNSNVAFLEKTREQMEEEDSKALKRTSESQADKAAKKQKLDEEVPVVDYEIYTKINKPYYKIIRADGSPQLFLSFLSLLRNFDREDLEMILLVERRYPLIRFTLDQMLNNVRLEVEEESEPIYYASKTMMDAQAHSTTTEKELLAVVYAFKKFRPYLVLSKTIVYTDLSALKYLLAKQDAKPRLLRWILLL
nr:reverse transcriptase domain-containing protein [Tanacetum cinerariifolium]